MQQTESMHNNNKQGKRGFKMANFAKQTLQKMKNHNQKQQFGKKYCT